MHKGKLFLLLTPFLLLLGVLLRNAQGATLPEHLDLRKIHPSEYLQNEILVKYKDDKQFTRVKLAPDENVALAIDKLNRRRDIEYAEPNFKAFALEMPADALYDIVNRPASGYEDYTSQKYAEQWALNNEGKTGGTAGADISWQQAYAEIKDEAFSEVVIAVVDSGLDVNHRDLDDKLITGMAYNVFDESTNVPDDYGHGTHVAGIAAAETNNLEGTSYEGVAGVGFVNPIKLFPIKVLDENGAGTTGDVAAGIYWSADHGAKVINLSVGTYWDTAAVREAVKYAWGKGVILVAAAGNSGNKRKVYPAYYQEVISVAATDKNDKHYSSGTYNDGVDVSAPGVEVLSTFPYSGYFKIQNLYGRKNRYDVGTGTSMASPQVAGLAALVFAKHPTWSNERVRKIIEATTDDLGKKGWDEYFGQGRINVYKAVTTEELPTPTPTPTPKPRRNRPQESRFFSRFLE